MAIESMIINLKMPSGSPTCFSCDKPPFLYEIFSLPENKSYFAISCLNKDCSQPCGINPQDSIGRVLAMWESFISQLKSNNGLKPYSSPVIVPNLNIANIETDKQ